MLFGKKRSRYASEHALRGGPILQQLQSKEDVFEANLSISKIATTAAADGR